MWGYLKGGQVKGIGQGKNYEELRSVLSPYILATCVAVIVVVVNVVAFFARAAPSQSQQFIFLTLKVFSECGVCVVRACVSCKMKKAAS